MPARRALLVASPDIPNDDLPGARQDVHNYESFLLSIEGGAWEAHEVSKLFNPSKADLLRNVSAMSAADYAFITFSGHGAHHVNNNLYETSLLLTASETCYVYEINPKNSRQFLVIDSCRAIVRLMSEALHSRAMAFANEARPVITRQQARALFDDSMIAADQGRVVAYSCKVGQTAGESAAGGVFSRALVNESAAWALNADPNRILPVKEAFDLAKTETYRINAP